MAKRTIAALAVLAVLFCALPAPARAAGAPAFSLSAPLPAEKSGLSVRYFDAEYDLPAGKATLKLAVLNEGAARETEFSLKAEDALTGQRLSKFTARVNGEIRECETRGGLFSFSVPSGAGDTTVIKLELWPEGGFSDVSLISFDFSGLDFGGSVPRARVTVRLSEEDVALTREVFPAHWTLDDNTLSLEYHDMRVNGINRFFRLEKCTRRQMWQEAEDEPWLPWLTSSAFEWLREPPRIVSDWPGLWSARAYLLESWPEKRDDTYPYVYDKQIAYLLNYIALRSTVLDGAFSSVHATEIYSSELSPLAIEWFLQKVKNYPAYMKENFPLYGRFIGVEFAENEKLNGTELWLKLVEDIDWDDGERLIEKPVSVTQSEIFSVAMQPDRYDGLHERGARVIVFPAGRYSREDVGEYLARAGADMLIVQKIYDGTGGGVEYTVEPWGTYISNEGYVGYRDERDHAMAREFYDQDKWYSEDPDWVYDPSEFIRPDDDRGLELSLIPAVVSYIGAAVPESIAPEPGNSPQAYVILQPAGFYKGYKRGMRTADAALETERARELLAANSQRLALEKEKAELEIASIAEPLDRDPPPAPPPAEKTDLTPYILLGSLALIAAALVLLTVMFVKERRKNEK